MPSVNEYVIATLPDIAVDLESAVPILTASQMAIYAFPDESIMTEPQKNFVGLCICLQLMISATDRAKSSLLEAGAGTAKAKFQEQILYIKSLYDRVIGQAAALARFLNIDLVAPMEIHWFPNAGVILAQENDMTMRGFNFSTYEGNWPTP
jgi:hypothetical protein